MSPAITTTTPMYMSSCKSLSTAEINSVGRPACIVVTFHPVTQNATGFATAMSTPAITHPTRTFCALACSSGPSARTKGKDRYTTKEVEISNIIDNSTSMLKLEKDWINVSINYFASLFFLEPVTIDDGSLRAVLILRVNLLKTSESFVNVLQLTNFLHVFCI